MLLSGTRLAPTFAESDVVKDFRYNAFFAADDAPTLEAPSYRLELSGLIADKRPWTVSDLAALPQESQITRHVCVEGWSMIGKWSGPRFVDLSATDRRRHHREVCRLHCADGYYGSIDMATALHPQTIMAMSIRRRDTAAPNTAILSRFAFPTKLGFKNPKWVTTIYVTNRMPGGFWEDRGYNWFSGS